MRNNYLNKIVAKPSHDEHVPYVKMYINLVPDDGQVLRHLSEGVDQMQNLVTRFSGEELITPWAEGEWTIKEILVHIIDDERIYAYRALRYARGDKTELPGFEQDDYVPESFANERSLESIFAEYQAVREATIQLFASFGDDVWSRSGIGSNNYMTVRTAIYHIAGHELHHMKSIEENYGG